MMAGWQTPTLDPSSPADEGGENEANLLWRNPDHRGFINHPDSSRAGYRQQQIPPPKSGSAFTFRLSSIQRLPSAFLGRFDIAE
jgi:hypothetical protein